MCSLVFICKRMQCNVPADCWRLQTAEFAPAYAYEPRLLLKYSRDSLHASKTCGTRPLTALPHHGSAPTRSTTSLTHTYACASICANHSPLIRVYRLLLIGTRPHDGTDPLVTSDAEKATIETRNAVADKTTVTDQSLIGQFKPLGISEFHPLQMLATGVSGDGSNSSCYLHHL